MQDQYCQLHGSGSMVPVGLATGACAGAGTGSTKL